MEEILKNDPTVISIDNENRKALIQNNGWWSFEYYCKVRNIPTFELTIDHFLQIHNLIN